MKCISMKLAKKTTKNGRIFVVDVKKRRGVDRVREVICLENNKKEKRKRESEQMPGKCDG